MNLEAHRGAALVNESVLSAKNAFCYWQIKVFLAKDVFCVKDLSGRNSDN